MRQPLTPDAGPLPGVSVKFRQEPEIFLMSTWRESGHWIAMLRRAGIGLGIAAILMVSAIPLLSGIAGAALVRDTNVSVCDRTEKVRDAIVTASDVSACALVTSLHIRDITTLDLSGQGITSLKAGDFDGLHRLDTLDLSGNSLATLPDGLFDDLYLLRVLRLNDNRLTALPVDIFDQLFLLEELTLSGNRLTALPEGMFDDLSRFKGVLTGDDVGGLARIRQFLADHEPETVEEFIAALPDLHKERFVFIYGSQALGSQFVSSTHPRVISWGADAEFIFTWLTNPDATDDIRKNSGVSNTWRDTMDRRSDRLLHFPRLRSASQRSARPVMGPKTSPCLPDLTGSAPSTSIRKATYLPKKRL